MRPRKAAAEAIEPGNASLPIDFEWHSVTVTCAGDRVTVHLDRQTAGTYRIGERSGAVLFCARGRTLELGNVTVDPTTDGEAVRLSELDVGSIESPRVVREVRPRWYPRAVMSRRVEGKVVLEAVVLEDGAVGSVSVVESLDPALD